MKRLMLFRHAKAVPEDVFHEDHARPLSPRGREAALLMGRYMRDHGLQAQHVISSSASRTQETIELAMTEWALDGEHEPSVRFDKGLYLAPPMKILATVHAVPDTENTVMLVGHNPGLHMLTQELAGSGDASAREALNLKFPTGTLAVLSFNVESWAEIMPGSGYLAAFVTPSQLGG